VDSQTKEYDQIRETKGILEVNLAKEIKVFDPIKEIKAIKVTLEVNLVKEIQEHDPIKEIKAIKVTLEDNPTKVDKVCLFYPQETMVEL
jgi:hypothetical protein